MSWLKSIFGRKEEQPDFPRLTDFSSIGTDIHSHLIPGIDDGSKSMEESIGLLRSLEELGYRQVVTTPHIMSDYFRNTPEIILGGLEQLRKAAQENGIGLHLEAAAEYYVDEVFVKMLEEQQRLLTIGGKYLLFEISYINPPENIFNLAFEMHLQGYVPVLAHPERYPYWYGKEAVYAKLKEQGVHFQLNTNSLVGYYGPAVKACAEHLVDKGMIEFIGSDMHGARHLEALRRVVNERYFWKLADQGLKNQEL